MDKKIIFFLIISLSIFNLVSCQKNSNPTAITEIYDGDTFRLNDGRIVRLYGVDTPELHDQYHDFQETDDIEWFYANEAKRTAINEIHEKHIKVIDLMEDKYHRRIVKLFVGNEDLGMKLLSLGLARVAYISLAKGNPFYTADTSYYSSLLRSQYQAYKDKVGIWRNPDYFKSIFPKAN